MTFKQRRGAVRAWFGRSRTKIMLGWLSMLCAVLCITFGTAMDSGPKLVTPDGDVSVTGLLADVRAGRVDGVVLDETRSVVEVTYEAGQAPHDMASFAARERDPEDHYVAAVEIPSAYMHAVIATLDRHSVPLEVRAGTHAVAPGAAGGGGSYEAPVEDSTASSTAGPDTTPSTAADEIEQESQSDSEADSSTSTGPGSYPIGGADQPASAPEQHSSGGVVAVISLGVLLLFASIYFLMSGYRRPTPSDPQTAAAGGNPDGPKAATAGGKDSHLPQAAEVPETRFTDVAGCDEAIADLTEMVLFLSDPDRFTRIGAKPPKGALLAGPPGTGKTLLARAVAGESGVPFFSASGSDFTEMYVGVGAKRVRDLFAAAKKHPRAIVFIDEIDAVARKRGGADAHSNQEAENTLIALLTEMDGFTSSGVIVLAATNRSDILDPALTRPGRLDRKVEVPNPDRRGRERILAVHADGKPVAADVDFTMLARRTPGFSGAQLAALVNEACLEAVRGDLDEVTAECFDHAVATIAMGRARTSALVTEHDREVTAWHEAGHTIAAYLQPAADDPVQVTIVPRGPAGGVTWMSGSDDIFLPKRKAHAQLVTALAGRAGEEALLGGEYTSGASGDLSSATQLATAMATQYGMTRLGYQVRNPQAGGGATADVVEELLAAAHVAATRLAVEYRPFLEALAVKLLDVETLTLAEVDEIARSCGVDRDAAPLDLVLELPVIAAKSPTLEPEPALVPAPGPLVAVAASVAAPVMSQSDPAVTVAPSLRAAGGHLLRTAAAKWSGRRRSRR